MRLYIDLQSLFLNPFEKTLIAIGPLSEFFSKVHKTAELITLSFYIKINAETYQTQKTNPKMLMIRVHTFKFPSILICHQKAPRKCDVRIKYGHLLHCTIFHFLKQTYWQIITNRSELLINRTFEFLIKILDLIRNLYICRIYEAHDQTYPLLNRIIFKIGIQKFFLYFKIIKKIRYSHRTYNIIDIKSLLSLETRTE